MKTIALIAHDHKKGEMVAWAEHHKDVLKNFNLVGTGHTATLIKDVTRLPIKALLSGPLGGDQQIGALIAEHQVDCVIFFFDPLESQPHDPDVKALQRIAAVYDIPIATTKRTADFLVHSTLFVNEEEKTTDE